MAGKLRSTKTQKGMVDDDDSNCRELIFMASAQIGNTVACHAILGHVVRSVGRPILIASRRLRRERLRS